MDNGQPTQTPNSLEMFTEGVGTKNTEDNSFEADKNLNLENWSPDRNPSAIGKTAINEAGPLPLPTTERTNLPPEVYDPTSESLMPAPAINQASPELGQVIPMEPTETLGIPTDSNTTTITDNSPDIFTWKQAMSGDRLSKNYINKFDSSVRKLNASGDIASFANFWADAGENFRKSNPKNASLNQEAA